MPIILNMKKYKIMIHKSVGCSGQDLFNQGVISGQVAALNVTSGHGQFKSTQIMGLVDRRTYLVTAGSQRSPLTHFHCPGQLTLSAAGRCPGVIHNKVPAK